MKRQDAITIRAELEHITSDVRDLEVSQSRAAALQCLADAMMHLGRIQDRDTEPMLRVAPSVPPSAADNQPTRNRANEAFRESRRILKGVLK